MSACWNLHSLGLEELLAIDNCRLKLQSGRCGRQTQTSCSHMQETGDFFGAYLSGGMAIVTLAIGSTNPGLLTFAIDKFSQVRTMRLKLLQATTTGLASATSS
jgi:hypothetical protein